MSLAALDVLRYLKSRHDYRTLAKITSISPSTLSRYCSGKTLPRFGNARKILNKGLELINPRDLVAEYFGQEPDAENGVYLSQDIQGVKILSSYALNQFIGSRVSGVVALDLFVLPLAACFASLTNNNLYFASEKPIWRDDGYIEVRYKSDTLTGRERIWLPIEVVKKGSSILVFTMKLSNQNPLKELLKTMERYRASVVGIFALAAKRKVWDALSTMPGCRKVAVLEYD